MPQCGFPNDKIELLPAAHKTSCSVSPTQTRMNPLNCKLGLADPFLLFVSSNPFTFVCFLHSTERTLLMDSGQLKCAACLRSSCCSTSTSQRRCLQCKAPAQGFLKMGSGPWFSEGTWQVESGAPSNGNTASTAFHQVGTVCPARRMSLEKSLLLSGKRRTNPARPCCQDL